VLSSRHEHLDAGLVVALQESEQLPGDDPFQAALDVSRALALGGPSGGVGAGLEVIAQADQRDGVQCLVGLPRSDGQGWWLGQATWVMTSSWVVVSNSSGVL
jgi:hypothetical protein